MLGASLILYGILFPLYYDEYYSMRSGLLAVITGIGFIIMAVTPYRGNPSLNFIHTGIAVITYLALFATSFSIFGAVYSIRPVRGKRAIVGIVFFVLFGGNFCTSLLQLGINC